MPPAYKKRKWSGMTGGANIPNKHIYLCSQCQKWHEGKKPVQCNACGHMEFIHFPSKAEAKRYGELCLEQMHGFITDLERQPRFPLHGVRFDPEGDGFGLIKDSIKKIGEYRGDFRYVRDGKTIVEDIKGGADTPLSAWKRKHTEAEYGITIDIVRR
jgi:DNA-directed RNA polymerase subunit RPC12/RpoP